MPKTYRLIGLPDGTVDIDKQEVRFSLSIAQRQPLSLVGKFGVITQVIAALGRMAAELRTQLDARGGKMAPISAEPVSATHIQKDRWSEVVLLQLITPRGVPYSFAISCQAVADIADRLRSESEKPTETGTA